MVTMLKRTIDKGEGLRFVVDRGRGNVRGRGRLRKNDTIPIYLRTTRAVPRSCVD